MLRRLGFFFICLMCFLCEQPPVDAAQRVRMMILPFKNISQQPQDDWLKESFSENLTMGLGQLDTLQLVERSEIKRLLKEQHFSQTAYVDHEQAPKLGRMLGAQYVVLGNFQKLGSQILINVKLVNIETGEIDQKTLTQVRGKFQTLFDLQSDLAAKLVAKLQLQNTPQELQQIKQTIAATDSTQAHQFYIEGKQALDKFSDEQIQIALQKFHQAVQEDPQYARAYAALGDAYFTRHKARQFYTSAQPNDPQKGIQYAQKAIELDPKLSLGYRVLGNIYYHQDDKQRAKSLAEKALALDKSNENILFYLTTKYPLKAYGQADIVQTMQGDLQALGADMNDPMVQFTLGALYLTQAITQPQPNVQPGIDLLEKARAQRPDYAMISVMLASFYSIQGEQEKAKQVILDTLDKDPENSFLLYLGAQLIQLYDKAQAVEYLNQALRLQPELFEAESLLASIYQDQYQDLPQAKQHLNKALQMAPESGSVQLAAGMLYFKAREYAQAELHLKKAMDLFQQGTLQERVQFPNAAFYLASVYIFQKQDQKAEPLLQAILSYPDALEIQQGIAQMQLARIYVRREAFAKALSAYQTFMQQAPMMARDPQIVLEYKTLYILDALDKDPQNPRLMNELGQLFLSQDDYEKAQTTLLKAVELAPENPSIRYNLGLVYFKQKNWVKAQTHLEKAKALRPNHALTLFNLGLVFYEQGDKAQAKKLWQAALKAEPSLQEARAALQKMGNE